MFSVRRYVLYFVISALALYNINRYLQGRLFNPPSTKGQVLQQVPVAVVPQVGNDNKAVHPSGTSPFQWASVPTRYPISSFIPLPSAKPLKLPKVQYNFPEESPEQTTKRKERQAAVRDAFQRSWKAYRDKAWMHDELAPISGSSSDKFGGWAATLVDNLDTLWIMGLRSEFEEAVQATMKVDTTVVNIESVNVFETTIRHLGGLLAAYDLSEDERLLEKAEEFGEMLYKTFDTPNHIPVTRWQHALAAKEDAQVALEKVLLAELGSLSMEFTRLSQLTGNPKWYDAIQRISLLFAGEQQNTQLPGMFPVIVGGQPLDLTSETWFTLNGMADSFFEYLPKMHTLLGGVEPVYRKLYLSSMTPAIKYTLFRPMTPDDADILFSGTVHIEANGPKLSPQAQHLGCFTGGMFALGGKLFDEPSHVEIGRRLADGCIWAYKAMPMGIMPELFTMVPCKDRKTCSWDEKLWYDHVKSRLPEGSDTDAFIAKNRLPKGFVNFEDPKYHLRPEALESVFMLYRMTGSETLPDVAWEMFSAIMKVTTTKYANAAMLDVTYSFDEIAAGKMEKNAQMDSMESFWMAETLKYLFLIFSEPDVLNLDEWVFNTEAHPFRRPTSK